MINLDASHAPFSMLFEFDAWHCFSAGKHVSIKTFDAPLLTPSLHGQPKELHTLV
jgi:hypothetical protein